MKTDFLYTGLIAATLTFSPLTVSAEGVYDDPNGPAATSDAATDSSLSGDLSYLDLQDETVFDTEANEVGTIERIHVRDDGTQAAVLSIREMFGIGGRDVLVGVEHFSKDGDKIVINLTKAELEAMPEVSS